MRSDSAAPETPQPDQVGADTGAARPSTERAPGPSDALKSGNQPTSDRAEPPEQECAEESAGKMRSDTEVGARDSGIRDAEGALAQAIAERVVSSNEFAEAVAQRLAEKVVDEVAEKVARQLAQEVVNKGSDQLADAVADRIAEAWQRVAERAAGAGAGGGGLRPRQRGSVPPRGRVPRA
jgi:hypothetical protein